MCPCQVQGQSPHPKKKFKRIAYSFSYKFLQKLAHDELEGAHHMHPIGLRGPIAHLSELSSWGVGWVMRPLLHDRLLGAAQLMGVAACSCWVLRERSCWVARPVVGRYCARLVVGCCTRPLARHCAHPIARLQAPDR